ncbi:uncharacterized protein LOC120633957 [Pararge aegeria]|uniref:uncharacterized protein LOC120633957 n=1 Tax=Pararge aegeria TaxID=116150 RepID=UPI0019D0F54C|nr:uncharacterized protein LOC120633957 [Pararge aegeria]
MSEISKSIECEPNILIVNEFDESVVCENIQREKRLRDSSGASIDEDGFTTVKRNRPKRLAVRKSSSSDNMDEDEIYKENQENAKIEVIITSKEILPKQMALAKLLRAENIGNILSVKYKSPYKVLVEFSDTRNAEKLLTNKKFADSDYRCQLTQEIQLSFGVVRNIDMEVQESEMIGIFESEYEILSIKRLRRFNEKREWIESESVRVCFKSSTLPSYILIYGCRFKVETFTFPVTQCSGCWNYGHSRKFCPTKRIICPKCGKQHPNCETKLYTCINCKGSHMALDKTCPVFYKEKEIRKIMCEENCKYRKALFVYHNKRKVSDRLQRKMTGVTVEHRENEHIKGNGNRTYRDVLVSETEIHNEHMETSSNSEKEEEIIETIPTGSQKVKKRKKKGNKVESTVDMEYITENIGRGEWQGSNKEKKEKRNKFDFAGLLLKIKAVCFSQTGNLTRCHICLVGHRD